MKLFTLAVLAMLAVTANAQQVLGRLAIIDHDATTNTAMATNALTILMMIPAGDCYNSNEYNITIGPVTICCTNGVVTINKGVTLDKASRDFWDIVSKAFPCSFPNGIVNQEQAAKDLAKGGVICRVLGHS